MLINRETYRQGELGVRPATIPRFNRRKLNKWEPAWVAPRYCFPKSIRWSGGGICLAVLTCFLVQYSDKYFIRMGFGGLSHLL